MPKPLPEPLPEALKASLPAVSTDDWLFAAAHEVRDRCLCQHLRAAAKTVEDRFDAALKPLGLTSGDYSLLVMLGRPQPPRAAEVAQFLVMDPAALRAMVVPLERRGLLAVVPGSAARGGVRLALTTAGFLLLAQALPIWRSVQASLDKLLAGGDIDGLRGGLLALAFGEP
ncbi:MAG: MarR family winged helix-turn-helix transcriptional regulator [Kiloniellaceae bacterium]